MINRCGEYCNTSKLVFIVDGRQKPPAGQTVRFTEDGDYYFWVQRQLEDGEAGPSVIEKLGSSERGFFVKFRSGTRSEEHTSELQSLMRISYAVFCIKKK